MFAARDGARAAGRFVAAVAVTAAVLIAALAPAALTSLRGANALVQNSVLFPLGLTHDKTPAESLLPGHLLTALGTAGHVASVGLLLAAGLGIAISLVVRPPRDVPAAAWRLAIGLTLMFLLGPQVRFGYFIYPLGLVGWLALIQELGTREDHRRAGSMITGRGRTRCSGRVRSRSPWRVGNGTRPGPAEARESGQARPGLAGPVKG